MTSAAASASDLPSLRRATERFIAAYHASPRLLADHADWSVDILLRTSEDAAVAEAIGIRVERGRGSLLDEPPARSAADITVTAELPTLLAILELRMSPNEPYLFGELLVDGPEADFLRLDYLVSSLCPR